MSIKSAFGAARERGGQWFDTILLLAVIAAASIAAWRYAGLQATDPAQWALLLLIGVAAIGFEFRGAEHMVRSWYERRFFAICIGAGLWTLGFLFSLNNAVGSAAQYQETLATTQKAAHYQHEDSRTALTEARRNLAAIDKRIESFANTSINGRPLRTPEAAQQDVDNAKANRFWALTKECTETKGPQTRTFCDKYRAAISERDMAGELLRLRDDRNKAAAELTKREATVQAAKVTTGDERQHVLLLSRITGDTTSASMAQTLHQALTICLFVTLAGFWRAYQACKDMPREPWFNWRGAMARVRQAWDGKEPPVQTTPAIQRIVERAPDRGRMFPLIAAEPAKS